MTHGSPSGGQWPEAGRQAAYLIFDTLTRYTSVVAAPRAPRAGVTGGSYVPTAFRQPLKCKRQLWRRALPTKKHYGGVRNPSPLVVFHLRSARISLPLRIPEKKSDKKNNEEKQISIHQLQHHQQITTHSAILAPATSRASRGCRPRR